MVWLLVLSWLLWECLFGFCSGSEVYALCVRIGEVGFNAVRGVGNQLVDRAVTTVVVSSGISLWQAFSELQELEGFVPRMYQSLLLRWQHGAQQYAMSGTQILLRACCW